MSAYSRKHPKFSKRWPAGSRWFYPLTNAKGTSLLAPKGYAFNGRGDLIKIVREERRIGRAITLAPIEQVTQEAA